MNRARKLGLILVVLSIAVSSEAASIDLFGLHHYTLGDANIASGEYHALLSISDLEETGTNGVATILGEADSGAFIYPTTDSVQSGYFMRGYAYGSLNGVRDRLIGSVYGYRTDYATFYTTADFSSIGATSLTFQLWHANTLVAQSTVASGEARLYAEYSQNLRVNPWCRLPTGEQGALIEFGYAPYVTLPGCTNAPGDTNPPTCPATWAHRIFIRPNGATGVVDFISRTEAFGGGGLPWFGFNDVRIGMFGRPHAAVGDILFGATNGTLRVDNLELAAEGGSGAFVQFDHTATAEVRLAPLDIALPNTNELQEALEVTLTGTRSGNYSTYVGAAVLQNSNGVLYLSTSLVSTNSLVVKVYSNNVPVGSENLSSPPTIPITGASRVLAVGVNADTLESPAGFSFTFETPAQVQSSQGALVGDRVTITLSNHDDIADVSGVGVITRQIPSFAITGEDSTTFIPTLSIALSNNVVVLRWPDPARAYRLLLRTTFEEAWYYVEPGISYENNSATVFYSLDESSSPTLFFQLTRAFSND